MNSKFLLSIISITCLLSGCASYKAQSLANLSPQSAPCAVTQEQVTVSCKAFTKQDCKRYLDRDVISKGFQPVQICIQNESKRSFQFSQNQISLPLADASYVAEKVHTSTVGRATAYGVGALILWPLAIPAIVDGVKSKNANEALDNDFASKTPTEQTLAPFARINGLLFVPVESYQEAFTLTLVDKETQEKLSFSLNAPRM
jgi:hypothetical protein